MADQRLWLIIHPPNCIHTLLELATQVIPNTSTSALHLKLLLYLLSKLTETFFRVIDRVSNYVPPYEASEGVLKIDPRKLSITNPECLETVFYLNHVWSQLGAAFRCRNLSETLICDTPGAQTQAIIIWCKSLQSERYHHRYFQRGH